MAWPGERPVSVHSVVPSAGAGAAATAFYMRTGRTTMRTTTAWSIASPDLCFLGLFRRAPAPLAAPLPPRRARPAPRTPPTRAGRHPRAPRRAPLHDPLPDFGGAAGAAAAARRRAPGTAATGASARPPRPPPSPSPAAQEGPPRVGGDGGGQGAATLALAPRSPEGTNTADALPRPPEAARRCSAEAGGPRPGDWGRPPTDPHPRSQRGEAPGGALHVRCDPPSQRPQPLGGGCAKRGGAGVGLGSGQEASRPGSVPWMWGIV